MLLNGTASAQPKAGQLFYQELAKAIQEGVTQENRPFFFQQEGGPAVLLIHGLTASPWEMKRLGYYLYAKGFTVYGIRLPGHGTSPEDLAGRKYQEWVVAAENGLNLLRLESPRVYLVGHSMGALLALRLTEKESVAGVVALAPAFKLRNRLVPLVSVFKLFKKYSAREIKPEHKGYFYEQAPLNAIHELMKLSGQVKKGAPNVKAPALVIQSRADPLVDPASVQAFYDTMTFVNKKLIWLELPVHNLVIEDNRELNRTFGQVWEFLNQLEEKYREGEKLPGGGTH